jgi:LacI family transcriptional regulator
MPKTPKVVLLLESSREYGRQLIFGITQYTYFHGPWSFSRAPGGRDQKIPNLKEWGADGIIAHVSNQATAEKIRASGIPAVIKGFHLSGLPSIQTDNAAIGNIGAEHLLERGFRKFAFCGYKNYWSQERLASFKARVEQNGYQVRSLLQPRSRASWENQQQSMAKWLKSLPKPIGLLASVDDRSQDVLQACKSVGIDVPTEVAIVGVDNDPLVCRLARPQLSSIALGAENAGYDAAELLDKLMAGEKMTGQTVITKATHVEVRQSTDILAMEDRSVAVAIHFIKQNLFKNISVDDVVDATRMARRTLQMRFKREIGRTIADEIRRLKSDQVARMLVTTNFPISKIALDLGFPGIDHISRSFKKEKGISPLEYRRRFGQN